MGVADSPLRDRVIFVQGAPRSGTTWLVTLLATHSQIAGVEAESHLFESGIDRLFDNFDGRDPHLRGLNSFLEHREQLVDLVRDLSDGVLTAMRDHVSRGPRPDFVVEKTPTSFAAGAPELRRKRECYPDAWFLHIVRDGEAVTRSLMRAPWMPDRSESACRQLWEDCVASTRSALGDHPRYREVSYEDLRADPAAALGELFEWLGVDAGPAALDTVRALSRERYSDLGAVPAQPGRRSLRSTARTLAGQARDGGLVRRVVRRGRGSTPAPAADAQLAFTFARALREQDAQALGGVTAERVTLAYRSADGDVSATGDAARAALLSIARQLFDRRQVNELWTAAEGGECEWWSRTPGVPFQTIFLSALSGDASRVDLAFGLFPQDGRISEVVVISAGPLAGRPPQVLESPAAVDAAGS